MPVVPDNLNSRITACWARQLLPYALFAVLVCLFLWRPIFMGRALLPGDYLAQMSPWNTVTKPSEPPSQWNPLQWDAIAQFYPWRVFYAQSMKRGTIPLWNPYQFSGTPFLANGQSAVLYPPNLVFLVFCPITAFTVYAALHLFLAATFMYLLLKALGCGEAGGIVGGICFAFCAFMVLWLELPTFIGAAVWLPLVLMLIQRSVERRSVFFGMVAGAALAMAFLAGHMQIAFYVALTACLWWAWKLGEVWHAEGKAYAILKVIVPFCAFVVISGLIAAPQVLPTLELGQASHRVREITPEGYARFVGNAVRPYRLITAFIPGFFGNPSSNDYFLGSAADYMEYGLYIGILPLVLALIAVFHLRSIKFVGFFAMLALLAILTATGTQINCLFYYLIPGFSNLGGPNRILLVYFFGVAALAGFGMDYFAKPTADRETQQASRDILCGLAATGLVAIVYAASYVVAAKFLGRFTSMLPSGCAWDGAAFGFLLTSVVLMWWRASFRVRHVLFAALVVCVAAADLFAFGTNYNPTCERAKVYPKTELTTKLKQIAGDSRIVPINSRWSLYKTPNVILPPNAAMVYGLHDVQGYDSLFTREYKDLSSTVQGEDSSPIENGNMVLVKRVTHRLPTVAKYFLTREPFTGDEPRATLVGTWSGVHVYELTDTRELPHQRPYEPFCFRFGLYLACVGVGMIACAGVNRVLRRRYLQR